MSLHNNKHVLIPIDPDSNHVLSMRPTVIVDSDVMHLGGNDDTGILDPRLEEQIVKVYRNNNKGKFYAYVTQPTSNVLLNRASMSRGTRRELCVGDVISMHNGDGVEYRYRFATTSATASETAAKGGTKAASETAAKGEAKAAPTQAPFPPQLGENVTCSVCTEILLHPRIMVPCGHSFCKDCGAQLTNCAECRGLIQSQMKCYSLQTLVEHMVDISTKTTNGILEKDDLDEYHKRKREAEAEASSVGVAAKFARK